MNPTFEEYGVTKGSDFVPDIASHLERTMSDSAHQKPLSDKAYSRFCRALGRLSWLSQVRHDLKAWLSLLGTQQQQPKHGTEQTLKAVLRFLLFVPSEQGTRDCKVRFQKNRCDLFTLALFQRCVAWTLYRFNQRKGISGGAIFFEGSLVRSLSRQQQAFSLSSCEAENP